MAGLIFAAHDLLAGPHDVDRGIEQAAELLEIERRPLAEGDIEDRIVRIIRRAAEDPARPGALGGEMDDRRLPLGEVGHVAAHVVEQESEILGARAASSSASLARQRRLPVAFGMEVELERAEADAEADACGAAEFRRRPASACQLGLGMRLLPAPAQEGVGLGRVEVEADNRAARGSGPPRRRSAQLQGRPKKPSIRPSSGVTPPAPAR